MANSNKIKDPKVIKVYSTKEALDFLKEHYGANSGRNHRIELAPGVVSLSDDIIPLKGNWIAKGMRAIQGFSNDAYPRVQVMKYGFGGKGMPCLSGIVYDTDKNNFELPLFVRYENGEANNIPEGVSPAYAVVDRKNFISPNYTVSFRDLKGSGNEADISDKILNLLVLRNK